MDNIVHLSLITTLYNESDLLMSAISFYVDTSYHNLFFLSAKPITCHAMRKKYFWHSESSRWTLKRLNRSIKLNLRFITLMGEKSDSSESLKTRKTNVSKPKSGTKWNKYHNLSSVFIFPLLLLLSSRQESDYLFTFTTIINNIHRTFCSRVGWANFPLFHPMRNCQSADDRRRSRGKSLFCTRRKGNHYTLNFRKAKKNRGQRQSEFKISWSSNIPIVVLKCLFFLSWFVVFQTKNSLELLKFSPARSTDAELKIKIERYMTTMRNRFLLTEQISNFHSYWMRLS